MTSGNNTTTRRCSQRATPRSVEGRPFHSAAKKKKKEKKKEKQKAPVADMHCGRSRQAVDLSGHSHRIRGTRSPTYLMATGGSPLHVRHMNL